MMSSQAVLPLIFSSQSRFGFKSLWQAVSSDGCINQTAGLRTCEDDCTRLVPQNCSGQDRAAIDT